MTQSFDICKTRSVCWAIEKKIEQKMNVADLKTFREMSGGKREDCIRNE